MPFFGIPIRNGISIGLGTIVSLATDLASPNPGPPWIVLTSAGTPYSVDEEVKSSNGTSYYVVETVLSSTGAAYNPI
jgi:hypothetical protein